MVDFYGRSEPEHCTAADGRVKLADMAGVNQLEKKADYPWIGLYGNSIISAM